jgi:hypothetical protein
MTEASKTDSAGAVQLARDILNRAVAMPTACDLTSCTYIHVLTSLQEIILGVETCSHHHYARNAVVGLGQKMSEDRVKQNTMRSVTSVFELADRLVALERSHQAVKNSALSKLNDYLQLLSQFNQVLSSIVMDLYSEAISGLSARVNQASSTVTSTVAKVGSVQARVTAARSSIRAKLNAEIAARSNGTPSLNSQSAILSSSISTATSSAALDRQSIRSQASSTTPLSAAITSINTASANGVNRQAGYASNRANAAAAAVASFSTHASSMFASEFARLNDSCVESLSRGGINIPIDSSGSNDFASW